MTKLTIGAYVATPYGNGVVEHESNYSVGIYYDVRLDDGGLVKCFHSEVSPTDLIDRIIEVNETRWLVRFATTEQAALNEIAHARVTGSIGGSTTVNGTLVSDVVQVNSDGTERKPYTMGY